MFASHLSWITILYFLVQCVEIQCVFHLFCYFFFFPTSYWRVIIFPVTPSWPETEVLYFIHIGKPMFIPLCLKFIIIGKVIY